MFKSKRRKAVGAIEIYAMCMHTTGIMKTVDTLLICRDVKMRMVAEGKSYARTVTQYVGKLARVWCSKHQKTMGAVYDTQNM
jgi:hypothetical protein